MEESLNYLPLLVVLILAFLVPLLLSKVRWLPIVVGEIAAGILIGRSGLNLVEHSAILDIMSNMGLAFLMFLAGMEINLNQLFPVNGRSQSGEDQSLLKLTPVVYLLTLALSIPGGLALNALGLNGNPWLLAFILSATSLGVVLPTLKQHELMPTLLGRAVFYSSLLADFLTVLLLTVFLTVFQNGLNIEVLSVSLLFVAFLIFYQLGERVYRLSAIQSVIRELSHVTVQIKVRGAITILMVFVVLAGVLGLEIVLGAFMAGMVIPLLRAPDDHEVIDKLEAFGYGFFIPIFFILVGVNLDLGVLVDSPRALLFLPALFLVALLVKTLPMLLFRRMLSLRETLAGAALVNTHLSIEIAVAVIGVRLGLLDPAANVTVIL
ncbi:MAG: cation:proton antiporter, partial [Chloroflexi bacterium]|nr:cation:proton antiporter [Chloroflexota bacterium]